MIVSGATGQVRLMESALEAQKTREEMSLAVLEKAQDLTRQQGEAMVRLVEESGKVAGVGGFDALA